MYENLTKKQAEILNFITKFISANGYPPSVREICTAVGLKSTSSVHAHLCALERLGYITKSSLKNRAISPSATSKYLDVPIIGKVTAGTPILAAENIEGYFPLPDTFARNRELFMLAVSGDSMINAGILDGDYVVVQKQNIAKNGDIVVALIDDEATVKTYYNEKGGVRLQPQNDAYQPIISHNVTVLGKVTGVFRKL
ncbi:MAG: LexA repressor [Firmicutes bacterium ADurb.Bin193]|nr:MAG: LexA repressor [Firmicutes bacterium ADurb.Bin193]